MSVAFMALFSLVLGDRISARLGRALLWPLILIGVVSVLYWGWTESRGAGDLRLYALVQFLPMILIPLFMLVLPQTSYRYRSVWAVIGLYVLAKIAEHWDAEIYFALGISGHSLKHIIAALPGLVILSMARHIEMQRCADPVLTRVPKQ